MNFIFHLSFVFFAHTLILGSISCQIRNILLGSMSQIAHNSQLGFTRKSARILSYGFNVFNAYNNLSGFVYTRVRSIFLGFAHRSAFNITSAQSCICCSSFSPYAVLKIYMNTTFQFLMLKFVPHVIPRHYIIQQRLCLYTTLKYISFANTEILRY